ncbi:hypothetical protein AMTR_s00413p00015560 [Amborella trichopoda]|uniref:Uncharacterized protein n=1 Tax=Amborella trichopoda TaxID=13333 RepID=W1PIE6_AMBTC|nr:hypothetical protein AMTR_s00413p00015560 [Amborella trichopoda]
MVAEVSSAEVWLQRFRVQRFGCRGFECRCMVAEVSSAEVWLQRFRVQRLKAQRLKGGLGFLRGGGERLGSDGREEE